jgi:hypothetical protein
MFFLVLQYFSNSLYLESSVLFHYNYLFLNNFDIHSTIFFYISLLHFISTVFEPFFSNIFSKKEKFNLLTVCNKHLIN